MKENIYLPLYNEIKNLKKDIENKSFDYEFKDVLINKILLGYEKNITSKRVIKLIEEYVNEKSIYSEINHKRIAITIIKSNFTKGFKELYGSEIKEYKKVRDIEGTAEAIEVYYDEIDAMMKIREEDIGNILHMLGTEVDNNKYNNKLCRFYDGFIDEGKDTIIELPKPKWADYGEEASKGRYIVEKYDFLNEFKSNNEIIKKYESREKLYKIVNKCIEELEYILIDIYNKYEKDVY